VIWLVDFTYVSGADTEAGDWNLYRSVSHNPDLCGFSNANLYLLRMHIAVLNPYLNSVGERIKDKEHHTRCCQ